MKTLQELAAANAARQVRARALEAVRDADEILMISSRLEALTGYGRHEWVKDAKQTAQSSGSTVAVVLLAKLEEFTGQPGKLSDNGGKK